jgi:hypothetical protein
MSGRSVFPPHFGQAARPFSCSLIDIMTVTFRLHLSQEYSYTGMVCPPTLMSAVTFMNPFPTPP